MGSESYPFCQHAVVPIGDDRWVELCHCVAFIPGMGQVWHTTVDSYVLSTVDVVGAVVWSVILEPVAFMHTLNEQGRLHVVLSND